LLAASAWRSIALLAAALAAATTRLSRRACPAVRCV
jgi:hypothetical protein